MPRASELSAVLRRCAETTQERVVSLLSCLDAQTVFTNDATVDDRHDSNAQTLGELRTAGLSEDSIRSVLQFALPGGGAGPPRFLVGLSSNHQVIRSGDRGATWTTLHPTGRPDERTAATRPRDLQREVRRDDPDLEAQIEALLRDIPRRPDAENDPKDDDDDDGEDEDEDEDERMTSAAPSSRTRLRRRSGGPLGVTQLACDGDTIVVADSRGCLAVSIDRGVHFCSLPPHLLRQHWDGEPSDGRGSSRAVAGLCLLQPNVLAVTNGRAVTRITFRVPPAVSSSSSSSAALVPPLEVVEIKTIHRSRLLRRRQLPDGPNAEGNNTTDRAQQQQQPQPHAALARATAAATRDASGALAGYDGVCWLGCLPLGSTTRELIISEPGQLHFSWDFGDHFFTVFHPLGAIRCCDNLSAVRRAALPPFPAACRVFRSLVHGDEKGSDVLPFEYAVGCTDPPPCADAASERMARRHLQPLPPRPLPERKEEKEMETHGDGQGGGEGGGGGGGEGGGPPTSATTTWYRRYFVVGIGAAVMPYDYSALLCVGLTYAHHGGAGGTAAEAEAEAECNGDARSGGGGDEEEEDNETRETPDPADGAPRHQQKRRPQGVTGQGGPAGLAIAEAVQYIPYAKTSPMETMCCCTASPPAKAGGFAALRGDVVGVSRMKPQEGAAWSSWEAPRATAPVALLPVDGGHVLVCTQRNVIQEWRADASAIPPHQDPSSSSSSSSSHLVCSRAIPKELRVPSLRTQLSTNSDKNNTTTTTRNREKFVLAAAVGSGVQSPSTPHLDRRQASLVPTHTTTIIIINIIIIIII
eukprot:gene12449-8537_t